MNAAQLKLLVDKMPSKDGRGMYTKINGEEVGKAIAAIDASGPAGVSGLIDLLAGPGEQDDTKPHYALHALALHVINSGNDKRQVEFAKAIALQIGGRRPATIQRYLCQMLQTAGGREVVSALGKVLTDEELCESAAQALLAIGTGASKQLLAAWPTASGSCRLTLVQSLGVAADSSSVDTLRIATTDEDRDVRIAASWALANIGDAGSVETVLKAADATALYERRKQTDAALLLAEHLASAGKKAESKKVYQYLRDTRSDETESHIKQAAEKALAL
ncbi:MAG: HEAT repeat domain-containing protein [Fuerstiella sp.]